MRVRGGKYRVDAFPVQAILYVESTPIRESDKVCERSGENRRGVVAFFQIATDFVENLEGVIGSGASATTLITESVVKVIVINEDGGTIGQCGRRSQS